MTFDPGRIRLSLLTVAGKVARTALACERPDVARMLRGQPADQAVALVPLIYSLCAKAQGVAARAALCAARGEAVESSVDAEVWTEAAREHAWKLFIDWPRQLGFGPDETFFVRLMRTPAGGRRDLSEALACHPLPDRLLSEIGDDEAAHLLARRIRERREELRTWLNAETGNLGRTSAGAIAPNVGEARVVTARGELCHRLVLDGGKIADYSIVAPTDTLFAPGGEATVRLEGLQGLSGDEADRRARLLVLAFDPCVPWSID